MKAILLVAVLALPSIAGAQESGEALAAPEAEVEPAEPVPEPVPEPPVVAVDTRQVLLETWIERRAGDESSTRVTTGVTGLITAGTLAGLSIWILADETFAAAGYGRVAVGATGIAVASIAMGVALYALIAPSPAESRLSRFRASARDEREVSRFEGELRADAEAARFQRYAGLALGVGALTASVGFVITTAALDSGLADPERIFGYGMGGILGVLGLAVLVLSLFDSPAENAWRGLEVGASPSASLRVLPWASADGAGVAALGSF